MKEIMFKGAGVAIITPFNETGIDFNELARLIDFNIENGTDAIIITGTTGESATMTDEEHKEAIKFTINHVNKRIPVIAGTGSNDTAYAMQLSKYAQEVGADGLLLVTPYYNKCSQKGLIKHFTYIADHTNIPIILYNVPSRTGVNIALDTYIELAKHPRIVAVKEASGDLSAIIKIKEACGDNLHIYSGNDDQIVPILSIGGIGVISVLSNVMPKEAHDICQLYFDGKVKESAELQIKLLTLINTLFIEVNPIPVKTALGLMGYKVGDLRMPLCEMAEGNLAKLKEVLSTHKLI
ncbi:4-hydroxy-tetrahydrodipicolinate synthase [Anaerosinus gibii]|uniref:4-hydroxy-tetrahydrodipicolinate synthase n=1 Tax=Selenobaculum gibii TaxID=3054208 RepID=A0A9Y2AK00_9FIRM|nr:4-hydroxy-tetrahydrodipicolinate synthase [Selenobaculum gbiensis]WIW71483.1 4-hydroxy-tetrahydrodipicolinate synthase [Selenobaculum gbiensis]